VPRVRHDLLVEGAIQRGFGDQPGAQPVRREALGLGNGKLRRRGAGAEDLVEPVAGQPPLDRAGGGKATEHRAAADFSPPQPVLERAHRTGLLAAHPRQRHIRPLPRLVGL